MPRRSAIPTVLLTAALVACGGDGGDASPDAPPAPWAGATELGSGESHTWGEGHRVTVHQIAHRAAGTHMGQEVTGLAAEVELCAGDSGISGGDAGVWRLYLEREVDWQGQPMTQHSTGSPSMLGLREPLWELHDASAELAAGACARGWIDFVNVYDEQGAPTRLGFSERWVEGDSGADVVWSAGE